VDEFALHEQVLLIAYGRNIRLILYVHRAARTVLAGNKFWSSKRQVGLSVIRVLDAP